MCFSVARTASLRAGPANGFAKAFSEVIEEREQPHEPGDEPRRLFGDFEKDSSNIVVKVHEFDPPFFELAKGTWRTARDASNCRGFKFDLGDMKEPTIYQHLGKCTGGSK